MITSILAFVLLALAFGSTLLAVTAGTTERLLWGTLLSSLGLGVAVQLRGGSYYGLLMVTVFIVTDLILYLFFRSLKLLPDRPALNARGDRIFRLFFLWLTLCGLAGMALQVFSPAAEEAWNGAGSSSLSLLHDRVWSSDWLLVSLPIFGLLAMVAGGFFLARRER